MPYNGLEKGEIQVDALKQAYEMLGVPENASKDEVERRYFILLKRHQAKIKSLGEEEKAQEEKQFEPYNQAYKQIVAHFQQLDLESNPIYRSEQTKSPLRRKIEHFLYYYKLHLLGGLAVLILIISLVHSFIAKQKEIPPDVSTMMVGAYVADETAPLETKMAELVPGWKRVAVLLNYTPSGESGTLDYAQVQKSVVLLAAERPDIYIVDDVQFNRLGQDAAFLPLEPWKDELQSLVPEDRLIYAQFPADTKPTLYGVDLRDSPVFAGVSQDTLAKIFTIRFDVKDPAKPMKLIAAMAKQLKAGGG
ncbi:MAG TPA: hypothetical protein VF260_01415 [Bacilli bacterium]